MCLLQPAHPSCPGKKQLSYSIWSEPNNCWSIYLCRPVTHRVKRPLKRVLKHKLDEMRKKPSMIFHFILKGRRCLRRRSCQSFSYLSINQAGKKTHTCPEETCLYLFWATLEKRRSVCFVRLRQCLWPQDVVQLQDSKLRTAAGALMFPTAASLQGSEETIRVVSMDKDYHVECYHCEVRPQLLDTSNTFPLHLKPPYSWASP